MDREPLRRGWCPSALRPMASGDGLLVRLAIPGQALSPPLARAIAACASRFGNGLVDLTQRANLQLRGVAEAAMPALVAELRRLGLAGADDEPELARNIIADPFAGLDPTAALDIRPVVADLHACLAAEPALRALPSKFCIAVEDGGGISLAEVHADIRFVAIPGESRPRFAVVLGGRGEDAVSAGECPPDAVPDVAIALCRAFLALAGDAAPRRMRDLAAREGTGAIVEAARHAVASSGHDIVWHHAPCHSRRGERSSPREGNPAGAKKGWIPFPRPGSGPGFAGNDRAGPPCIGFHDLGNGQGALGIGAPFGRLTAGQIEAVADMAGTSGGELRLTPWRSLIVTHVGARDAAAHAARLAAEGLIADPADARLLVAACPGAPACARATTPVRDDAAMLAPMARALGQGGIALHVSGCAKGCARAASSPVTLVGRDGRYDLVRDGAAGDAPWRHGLTLFEVEAELRRLAPDPQAPGSVTDRSIAEHAA